MSYSIESDNESTPNDPPLGAGVRRGGLTPSTFAVHVTEMFTALKFNQVKLKAMNNIKIKVRI